MKTLSSGSSILEPLCAAHASEMFAVLSDPAIYEFESEPPVSLQSLRDHYAKLESRASPEAEEVWLNWAVRQPSGELAGFVQATVLETTKQAYVAYVLSSRYWRKGIASTAVRTVLNELASTYSVKEAFAVLKAANYRSLALLRKLGFEPSRPEAPPPWHAEDDEVTMQLAIHRAPNAA
jgi:RimJ/RimL family protein N-acetyltransferase